MMKTTRRILLGTAAMTALARPTLAFPDRTLKSYVHSIDLFKEHADIVRAQTPSGWDEPTLLRFIDRARRRAA